MNEDPCAIPELVRIAEGFHLRNAIDNIAWFDLGGELAVVDALEEERLAGEVFDAIASTVPQTPVRYVFNTHTHYDHVALNDAFAQRWGAEIVNAETTDLPDEGRTFRGPKRSARMIPMPGCHTQTDCAVWVEPDRVLFVGDLFGWGLIPLTVNLRPETREHLLATYRRLIDFQADLVIPGHGPLCDTDTLRRWVAYFQDLAARARQGAASGLDEREIAQRLEPPQDMRDWWRFVQWKHEDTAAKLAKSAKRGWL